MSDPRPPRVRFAPSPTGALHLGNARTALFNWLIARQQGGALVLRIEDTDVAREQAGAEAGILEDLRWLGLDWDEGPDVGGPHAPYRQSERRAAYAKVAQGLLDERRAYRCFCPEGRLELDRKTALAAGRQPHYSGRCRGIPREEAQRRAAAGEASVLRFDVRTALGRAGVSVRFRDRLRGWIEVDSREIGDFVLLRSDGRPTYNFAVVVDDGAMAIDMVLRGDDHLSNTPRQVLLFEALGHRVPEFVHLPTVRGEQGGKLSKRHGAVSVADCRKSGYPPEAVRNALVLLGWSPGEDRQVLGRDEMLREFDLDRVHRAAARFDAARLEWLAGQHFQRREPGLLGAELGSWLVEAGRLGHADLERAGDWLTAAAELVRHSVGRFPQAVERCAVLFANGGEPATEEGRAALRDSTAVGVLEALGRDLRETTPEKAEQWTGIIRRLQRETGVKGRRLFHTVRVALTGDVSGPELDRVVPLVVQGNRRMPERIASLETRVGRTLEWVRVSGA